MSDDEDWKRRAEEAEAEVARLKAEQIVDEVQAAIGDKDSKIAARAGRLLSALGNLLLAGDTNRVLEHVSEIAARRVKDKVKRDMAGPEDEG